LHDRFDERCGEIGAGPIARGTTILILILIIMVQRPVLAAAESSSSFDTTHDVLPR
jgi:hypothetical protein